jgi:ribosomal protein S18 acetylase RimI-like enzyme
LPDPIPRPALEAPVDELLKRTQALRLELLRRGEFLPPSWSEEAARDLRSGELAGFWLSSDGGAPGLAVYSRREGHLFAHVHLDPGADPRRRGFRLLEALIRAIPAGVRRADVGLSGLTGEDEAALTGEAVLRFGGEVLVRFSLERPVAGSPSLVTSPPGGGSRRPIRTVPLEALAELDWKAFRGSPDERLVADTLEEERRSLGELLDGRLGPVLESPSAVFVDPEGHPLGFALVAEQAPGRSIVLDLAVDPAHRRRGIGSYLLRTAIEELRASGGTFVRLWVTESNRPARDLYDRVGFRLAHSARIYRWGSPG